MPIPALTSVGLLPVGIHTATLEEVRATFGSQNDTRVELFAKLSEFLDLARSFGLFTSIVIDGSFVTDKPVPSDIDAVLILPSHMLKPLLQRPDYGRLDNVDVKEKFAIDLFIEDDHEGMADFFQKLKIEDALERGLGPRYRRGIVEVTL